MSVDLEHTGTVIPRGEIMSGWETSRAAGKITGHEHRCRPPAEQAGWGWHLLLQDSIMDHCILDWKTGGRAFICVVRHDFG